MSLIVLNSKGEDPEDFQNYMTENIEFPANAEVCLVGSHINRRLLIAQEVQFSSQGNRLAFQYGTGNLLARTVGNSYTPHSPYAYEFQDPNEIFPVKFVAAGQIEAAANTYMNNPVNTPISTLVGGWENIVPASGAFEFHNLMRVPDAAQSLGTEQSICAVPGNTKSTLPNNQAAISGSDFQIVPLVGGAAFANWTCVVPTYPLGGSAKVTNFVDLKPLFNTDNGQRQATFTPLASGFNIEGGGWNWQFTPTLGTERSLADLRGGIITAGGELIDPAKGDSLNGINSTLNNLSNNTNFTVWWETERMNPATGAGNIVFYKRPVLAPGNKAYTNQMDGAIEWARAVIPASPEELRVSMRPTNDPGGLGYVLEGYCSQVTTATNALLGPIIPAVGTMKITDPLDNTEALADKCNLYRHLPLHMGATTTNTDLPVCMNAIHHGDHDGLMGAAEQTASLPYTFGFGKQTVLGQITEKFDAENWNNVNRATVGYALGYQSAFLRIAATQMPPAPGTGARAELPLGQTIPLAHSLVVSLPDLPISGFFGNSTGTTAAGTLGLNSGGTSAAIIGVIPFALGNAPTREASPIPGINRDSRGTFYSSPIENWIKLKNPHAFKVSSLRCRLTDELGTKPNVCAGNTTITIKIKAPRVGDVDRGLTIQGN
tara:strand:- start:5177 stop:7153 length:1977 start_codon:yes stop_codon:yes gene_type:complete